jgi:hypothetical protein
LTVQIALAQFVRRLRQFGVDDDDVGVRSSIMISITSCRPGIPQRQNRRQRIADAAAGAEHLRQLRRCVRLRAKLSPAEWNASIRGALAARQRHRGERFPWAAFTKHSVVSISSSSPRTQIAFARRNRIERFDRAGECAGRAIAAAPPSGGAELARSRLAGGARRRGLPDFVFRTPRDRPR